MERIIARIYLDDKLFIVAKKQDRIKQIIIKSEDFKNLCAQEGQKEKREIRNV